jgi:hypothetical protein
MNTRWAWSLPIEKCHTLGPLRRWSGVEACEVEATVWLRASHLEDEQWERCRHLPGADRYTVLDDGQLLPVGHLAPRGYLPGGGWQPLAQWLAVAAPTADTTCRPPTPSALKLVRSTESCEPNLLLTTFAAWSAYTTTAPQVRLARWSFAADRDGHVAIRGTPLPPLLGQRFVEEEGVAVPAGWTWSPRVDAVVLRDVFGLDADDVALWNTGGSWQRIAADAWVQATRSAVRLTVEELARGR